jgi:hypothetical protein
MSIFRRTRVLGVLGLLALLGGGLSAAAVEIVAPKDGAIVPLGSELVVQARPSEGDDIVRVYLNGSEDAMKYNDQTGFFEQRIKLRGDAWGAIEIGVNSVNSKGVVSTAEVKVEVKLPPVLPLISLRIHAEQRNLILEGLGDRQSLQVIGEFPDGTVRFISPMVYGTSYLSRNPEVATVDGNGWVTAVGFGETVIVVRNGDKEAQAMVTVRSKPSMAEKKET